MTPWLAWRREKSPELPALSHRGRKLSYGRLAERAARRAGFIRAAGIETGRCVALQLGPNALENTLWIHALWWSGAAILPLGANLPDRHCAALLQRLQIEPLIDLRTGSLKGSGMSDACSLVDAERYSPVPACHVPAKSHCTVILTSGSSAQPKAVPMTPAQHAASTAAVAQRLALSRDDQWLCCLPLDHIGGMAILIRAVMTGASASLHDRFDAACIGAEIHDRPITRISLVPTMLQNLLEAHSGSFSSRLQSVLVGGAAAAPELLDQARRRGLPVLPTWGMTEAGSQLATPSSREAGRIDFLRHPGWVGPPLPGVEVHFDQNQRLRVRGPMLFSGYFDDDRNGPDGQGWFTTDDLGYKLPSGHLYVTGRVGRSIISGGINVSLSEVERRMLESGLLKDVALAPQQDPHWGQRIAAIVVPKAGSDISMLQAWSRHNLAPAERPRRWLITDRLPRSSSGKVLQEQLQRMLCKAGMP